MRLLDAQSCSYTGCSHLSRGTAPAEGVALSLRLKQYLQILSTAPQCQVGLLLAVLSSWRLKGFTLGPILQACPQSLSEKDKSTPTCLHLIFTLANTSSENKPKLQTPNLGLVLPLAVSLLEMLVQLLSNSFELSDQQMGPNFTVLS